MRWAAGWRWGMLLNMDLSRSVASFASSSTLSMATADPSAKETPSSASTSAYSRSLGCKEHGFAIRTETRSTDAMHVRRGVGGRIDLDRRADADEI